MADPTLLRSQLQRLIGPDESLLWSGCPDRTKQVVRPRRLGRRFQLRLMALGVFVLVLLWMIISTSSMDVLLPFTAFALLVVALDAILVFRLRRIDAQLGTTIYGLTHTRLILYTLRRTYTGSTTLLLAQIHRLDCHERTDGYGDLTFSIPSGVAGLSAVRFAGIQGVRHVEALVLQLLPPVDTQNRPPLVAPREKSEGTVTT